MFSFLLVLISSASNESQNYVICNNKTCHGECKKDPEGDDYCYTELRQLFCTTGIMYPIVIGSACVPTLFFMILSCFCKSHVTVCTWITNILINIFTGLLMSIMSCIVIDPAQKQYFAFITLPTIFSILVYSFARFGICSYGPECFERDQNDGKKLFAAIAYQNHQINMETCSCLAGCCDTPEPHDPFNPKNIDYYKRDKYYDTLKFLRERKAPIVSLREINDIIEENAIIPPTAQVVAVQFVNTKDGPLVVQKREEPITYGSWQELSIRQKATGSKIIFKATSTYRYEENLRDELNRAGRAVLDKLPNDTEYKAVYDTCETSGMTRRALVGDSCIFKASKNCLFRTLYELLFLFGYNGIIEFFWSIGADYVNFHSFKVLSAGNDYRAAAGERDVGYLDPVKQNYDLDMKEEEALNSPLV